MKPQCAVLLVLAMLLFSPLAVVLDNSIPSDLDSEINAVMPSEKEVEKHTVEEHEHIPSTETVTKAK